jgi:hypothetical protein
MIDLSSIKRVPIRDWLQELRTTKIPQSIGPADYDNGQLGNCRCALTVALAMSNQEGEYISTSAAIVALIGEEHFYATDEVDDAFHTVFRWNDSGMSFADIADTFEATYPHIIAQLEKETAA